MISWISRICETVEGFSCCDLNVVSVAIAYKVVIVVGLSVLLVVI